MKKLLLLLLFIPLMSFGQDLNLNVDKKVEISKKTDVKKGLGYNYLGSSIYSFSIEGKSSGNFNLPGAVNLFGTGQKKGLEKEKIKLKAEANNAVENFTSNNEWSYNIISEEVLGGIINQRDRVKVIITFKVFNKDGSLVLTKEEAKKELLSLKEYLDLGIITQEEFNTKAVSLKKILLGN